MNAPQIISRAEAKARGLKRYFTGKACPHGHIAERQISGGCIVCSNAKRNAVLKERLVQRKALERCELEQKFGREILTAAEARVRGLKRFFSGVPCPQGHIAERESINGGCLECGRERRKTARFREAAKLYMLKRKVYKVRHCVICKNEIGRHRSNYAKTCSRECSIEMKKRRFAQRYKSEPEFRKRRRLLAHKYRSKNIEVGRAKARASYRKRREVRLTKQKKFYAAVQDLLIVLRTEMPELLKEFGL